MSWALFAFGIASALLALNAWRPPRAPGSVALVLFFVAWPTIELAMHHVVVQTLVAGALVYFGALAEWQGAVGLALVALASLSLVVLHARGARAEHAFTRALASGLGDTHATQIASHAEPWLALRVGSWHLVSPFTASARDVTVKRSICFSRENGVALKLDVHAPRATPLAPSKGAPTLVYVHGGGWIVGYRRYQGLPLMRHLASLGWVCFSVDYRLSPRATFPDPIVDVKRAIAWVRAHAAEYGADPDFIVVAGNSAGAQLAALAALTPNDPAFQPGFEDADTRVDACVGFYGIYDFEDRHGHWPHGGFARFAERTLFKAKRAERPELFAKTSPIARVHRDAPPFLLVHGDRDTLAPTDESRRFAEALRVASDAPVVYVEIEDAQHAFEVFASPRAAHAVHGTTRFLAWVHSRSVELRAALPRDRARDGEPRELPRRDERLAARHEADADVAIGIGPSDDVREPDVAERAR
jgi:acetyl esterase/lipase